MTETDRLRFKMLADLGLAFECAQLAQPKTAHGAALIIEKFMAKRGYKIGKETMKSLPPPSLQQPEATAGS